MNRKSNYKKYLAKIEALGYLKADIQRHLVEYMSFKTVERYFLGMGVNKTNQQIIETHIDNLEPKKQMA